MIDNQTLKRELDSVIARSQRRVPLWEEFTADMLHMSFWAPNASCRLIIYSTKSWTLFKHLWNYRLPHSIAMFGGAGLVNEAYRHCIAAEARRLKRPIHYFGDLDPLDLANFLSLKVAVEPLGAKVKYAGVGGAWLRNIRNPITKGRKRFIEATILMSPFEKMMLSWLETMSVDWDSVVGAEAMKLLRAGRKLEVEGAIQPYFHGKKSMARALNALVASGDVIDER
jgi:hypothetical protein